MDIAEVKRVKYPVLTYVFDWGIAIICLILFLVLAYAPIDPVTRDYNVNDISISYPIRTETIGTALLVLLSFIIPLIVLLIVFAIPVLLSLFSIKRKKKVPLALDLNSATLGMFQSWTASSLFVYFIKDVVGSLRPDFLARCMLDTVSGQCTGDPAVIAEGRRSFPSLHASMSASGLCFLSFYIAGKLHPYRGEGYFWKSVVSVAPSVLALYIALTRVADNQHHPVDVFFGLAIGLLFAWAAYRHHYPSLSDPKSEVPLYILMYFKAKAEVVVRPADIETPADIESVVEIKSSDDDRGDRHDRRKRGERDVDRHGRR